MKLLKDILYGVAVEAVVGSTGKEIERIDFDSRLVTEGSLFVAQRGLNFDGHEFIHTAIEKGARAVLCQQIPEKTQAEVTYVAVEDTQQALAKAASNFFDNPSKELQLVGITGTNGKTTIATLLYRLFQKAGHIGWFDLDHSNSDWRNRVSRYAYYAGFDYHKQDADVKWLSRV